MAARRTRLDDGPIVAHFRAVRERIAEESGFDIDRLAARLRAHQAASGRPALKSISKRTRRRPADPAPRRRPSSLTIARVREARRKLAEDCNFDVHELARRVRQVERESARPGRRSLGKSSSGK